MSALESSAATAANAVYQVLDVSPSWAWALFRETPNALLQRQQTVQRPPCTAQNSAGVRMG